MVDVTYYHSYLDIQLVERPGEEGDVDEQHAHLRGRRLVALCMVGRGVVVVVVVVSTN